jgi:hypothetical protein
MYHIFEFRNKIWNTSKELLNIYKTNLKKFVVGILWMETYGCMEHKYHLKLHMFSLRNTAEASSSSYV